MVWYLEKLPLRSPVAAAQEPPQKTAQFAKGDRVQVHDSSETKDGELRCASKPRRRPCRLGALRQRVAGHVWPERSDGDHLHDGLRRGAEPQRTAATTTTATTTSSVETGRYVTTPPPRRAGTTSDDSDDPTTPTTTTTTTTPTTDFDDDADDEVRVRVRPGRRATSTTRSSRCCLTRRCGSWKAATTR